MKLVGGGITLLLISCFVFYLLYNTIRSAARIKNWPAVHGTLVSAEIEKGADPFAGDIEQSRKLRPRWQIKVKYTYEVAGREYTGDRFSNNPITEVVDQSQDEPPKELKALLERFKRDSPLEVRYHPTDSTRSYLYYRPAGGLWLLSVVGCAFLGLGILLIIMSIKKV